MKNKITYLPIGILTLTTSLAGVALSSARVAADTTGSRTAAVTVGTACNFTTASSYVTDVTLNPGATGNTETLSRTMNQVTCNNPNGFRVQAVGFSPDVSHPSGLLGNTAMYGSAGTIATGTSGTNSYWSFRVSSALGTSSYTIPSGYGSYSSIPSSATDILTFASTTNSTINGFFRTDYQFYVASTQPTGSYSGAVKYTIVPGV